MRRLLLLGVSAAATAGLLIRSPAASPDATFPLLVIAVTCLAALLALEHHQPALSRRAVLGVAAALLLLAVVRPPHGSDDLWSYAFYGRTLSHYHVSPYTHRPADFPGDPTLARVALGWREARSVYGPGFTVVSAAVTAVAGTSATLNRVGFQGLAAIAVLGAAALLARRRVPAAALAAVLLNPLIVVTVVNGGHNDALVGLAILAAALALRRHRPVAAGLLVAGAILVKAVAVLPAVAVVVWVWRRDGRAAATKAGAALALPVVGAYAAFGGLRAIAPVFAASTRESRISVWGLLPEAHPGVLAAAAVVALTAALVGSRIRQDSAVPVLVASLAGYLLVAAYVLPWYFAWVLPLAVLDWESGLSRLLVVQTVATLIAYQYQRTRHPDDLDRVLHSGIAAAQLFALAATLVLLVAAVVTWRTRADVPA